MGIRFFDLRVAHKPNDPSDDLYFTHVIYTHVAVLVSVLGLLWLLEVLLLSGLLVLSFCTEPGSAEIITEAPLPRPIGPDPAPSLFPSQ